LTEKEKEKAARERRERFDEREKERQHARERENEKREKFSIFFVTEKAENHNSDSFLPSLSALSSFFFLFCDAIFHKLLSKRGGGEVE